MKEKLSQIVNRYPLTDKGLLKSDGSIGHNYTFVYDMLFEGIRDQSLNILEIGFGGGDSLKMWTEYFNNATVFCIDNNLNRLQEYNYTEQNRINIFYGDQSSESSIRDSVKNMSVDYFDIIIDDGSHIESHIITSFEVLFPILKSGGLYFIEDCPTRLELIKDNIEHIAYYESKSTSELLICIKKK